MRHFVILYPRILFLTIITGFLFNACQNQKTSFPGPSPATQPYNWFTAEKLGPDVLESPDPLVGWRWKDPQATDELEVYTLRPVSVHSGQDGSFEELQALVSGNGPVTVKGTGTIMMDFGQVNAAWLEFDSDDFNGSVEMSISEYNEPAILNAGAQHRIKTLEPVKYGNTYRLELNDELYEGVRFGWIHVRSIDAPWHIRDVRLVCQIKPTNYRGSFQCNDPELTRIWYTGAYGVKLNLLKDFYGAILMERSDRFSWTGDAFTSQAASLVAFGNYDFILTNIHHTADQNNGILSYSMYWIQSLVDYYYYTGDSATLIHFIDNARIKLDRAYSHYGTDPKLTFYGWDERIGAGFEDHSCKESQNAYKMLCIDSWQDFARMMESLGRTTLSAKYEGYALEKIEELRQDPEWYAGFGVHAASDAINAGFTSHIEQEVLFHKVFSDRLNRLSYSPFNQYFIIQSLAKVGRPNEALETIGDCWGGQLDYGATSFFEVYRPSWNKVLGFNDAPPNNQCGYTSFCHPWGGGVVKWLTEEVLGIKPVQPGFRQFDVFPHPGTKLTQVSGTMPTPMGGIHVSYDVSKGNYEIDVPDGLEARIGIPFLGKEIVEIELNGKLVWSQSQSQSQSPDHVRDQIDVEKDFIVFPGRVGGSHIFRVSYEGEQKAYPGSNWIYPAGAPVEDAETSGNWMGIYGSDGYILCAYHHNSDTVQDELHLPAYVKEVNYSRQLGMQWADGVSDSRAPAPGPGNEAPRNVGAIYTQDPLATLQTMTVDIHMKAGTEHQIALYFVDWDDAGRRLAVEMFDLESRRIIAPVQVVNDYSGGKFLVFKYNAPVRFRINHIRGPNATLSGIFFD
ncbi:MAG: hypothetical protein DRI98_04925 [Bacteroidetes bacterium]|nr:MAG: hypothetical protein DRI98_04925 [Bacteroidota bacterium]